MKVLVYIRDTGLSCFYLCICVDKNVPQHIHGGQRPTWENHWSFQYLGLRDQTARQPWKQAPTHQAMLLAPVFFLAKSVGSIISSPGFIWTVRSVVLSTLCWKHLRRGGVNSLNTWLGSLSEQQCWAGFYGRFNLVNVFSYRVTLYCNLYYQELCILYRWL